MVAELVDEHVDLVPIRAAYDAGRAAPRHDPRLMVRILLYAYTTGVCSSRVIERKCFDDVPFRWLTDGAAPDYRAIARFRKRHSSALVNLFVEALALCQAAGMVRLGQVPLDRTRMRDSVSKRQVMRYMRSETESVLAEQVWTLLTEAESIDEVEDATSGKKSRDDESPEQLRRRETRLAKIREGNGRREAEAAQRAAPKPKARRALLGAFLVAVTCAGGYAVAAHKTVTLVVDGSPMMMSTMRSRVIDVVRDNGYAVGDHDDLYPAANQPIHQSDTIVLRRGRPLQVSVDGQQSRQVWTTALTVGDALKRLSMSDAAPAAASRASRLPLAGMALSVVSAKNVHIIDGGVAGDRRLAALNVGMLLAARRAVGTGRQSGAAGVDAGHRGHADRGHPHPDAEGHHTYAAAAIDTTHRGPRDEHEPLRRRRSRHTRHPGRHLRRVYRQRSRNRPTADGPRHRDTCPALGAADRCQAGHHGAAREQRRDLGCAGRM